MNIVTYGKARGKRQEARGKKVYRDFLKMTLKLISRSFSKHKKAKINAIAFIRAPQINAIAFIVLCVLCST
ncbi:MAG: hypothetical protein F6K56_02955 [Moorea sp. SIO3G5]|nr:hypothetical protein [Moorena sp. SIO3G5]